MREKEIITRRRLLQVVALTGGAFASPRLFGAQAAITDLPASLPSGTREEAVLHTLSGKRPLIKLTYRPPNYETPLEYLRTAITPNDAFFVRYHIADIPEIEIANWRLTLGGEAAKGETELTFDDLRKMPASEVVAVNHCAGNRRGLFQPHVRGVQWGYGGMGCARWKGPRLKDVLDKVGLKKEAIEIVFDGNDGPTVDKTPDFVKSIPVSKALQETTLIAYEMNGQPLPHWNGFPARLIVPGWNGTYWVKHLVSIRAVSKAFDGYWMKSSYRIPAGKFPIVDRFLSQETETSIPVTEMVVNSLITSHKDGAMSAPGKLTIGGLAWDGGFGIQTVEISTDGGTSWTPARLGENLGRFAFRSWTHEITIARGKNTVTARAINVVGQAQTASLILNPAGYQNNVMQTVTLIGV